MKSKSFFFQLPIDVRSQLLARRENSSHINNRSLLQLRPENTYLEPEMYVFMAHANLVGSEKDVDNAKGAQKEHNYRMSHFAEFIL